MQNKIMVTALDLKFIDSNGVEINYLLVSIELFTLTRSWMMAHP